MLCQNSFFFFVNTKDFFLFFALSFSFSAPLVIVFWIFKCLIGFVLSFGSQLYEGYRCLKRKLVPSLFWIKILSTSSPFCVEGEVAEEMKISLIFINYSLFISLIFANYAVFISLPFSIFST